MSWMWRALFVICAIVVGRTAVDLYFNGTAAYAPRTARMGDGREAKVPPACYDAFAAATREPGAPPRPAPPHRVYWQDYERAVELAAALNCYLVTQTNAVCERDNRAFIVGYLAQYFDKMDEMLGSAARYGDDEVRYVKTIWNSSNNRSIAAALEDHIRRGRLHTSDFGWSAPAPLKAQLAQWAKATDGCAGQRPWVPVKVIANR